MLGVPGLMGNASADVAAAAAAAPEAQESGGTSGGIGGATAATGTIPGAGGGGGGGSFSDEDKTRLVIEEEGEREAGGGGGGGGNRWPLQETSALLKIRTDMGVAFRDSSLKGPLWEQVARKMADLGYHRSAKKCREKFENVFKYHKRTKEGRSTKPEGKTYRFFDQLEALENTPSSSYSVQTPPSASIAAAATRPSQPQPISAVMPMQTALNVMPHPTTAATTNAAAAAAASVQSNFMNSSSIPPPPQAFLSPQTTTATTNVPRQPAGQNQNLLANYMSNFSTSSSSSTSSDEDLERRHKRKRKWKEFFGRLMKDVIDKQEELHKRFLETIEKRERDRMIREEAWRVQETARIKREHELLVQERSLAAARESALVTFLQKMTNQQHSQQNHQNPSATQNSQVQLMPIQLPENPPVLPSQLTTQPPPETPAPASAPAPGPPVLAPIRTLDITPRTDNGGENTMTVASSSRWPKAEVEALIQLRTNLDNKYQETGPKGPLWEDISEGMRKLGYNRSAKRCKEKWENINKYFKKVKESNKKRPEDSKTCPYFHQLDALYREKAKADATSYNIAARPENPVVPIMARPEQQWPVPQQMQESAAAAAGMEEHEGENVDRNDDHDEEDDDDDDGDDDDEEEGGGYEIVTNKPPSVATTS